MRILLTCLLFIASQAFAQDSLTRDGYTVYYSAIPTLDLTPEVARGYAITRSEQRALLNISIRRDTEAGNVAVRAAISGSVQNDAGQAQRVTVREIREGDAIYYLAEPRMRPGDTLRFDLVVTPEGSTQPISVRFSRPFFR
ncbi:DUF4426 domain-containing protein [Pseudomarimonas salicorniae]|uniref:DUF4426 domain-containing protein n=1 Tax=Pseudomarimonas salicorniae TaxID=2933270 RepID=A0ABT0GK07_9GAMM|nr:DUF4426 domain-containing protein [Lysobacter sp. CAU 1642]MCK7594372.1 DUF4426 domain-containing protein [Lysobacter sp. CAU 1642]